jgi:hypothetical protein
VSKDKLLDCSSDSYINLVYVLTSRAKGADEIELDLAVIDFYIRRNLKHALSPIEQFGAAVG